MLHSSNIVLFEAYNLIQVHIPKSMPTESITKLYNKLNAHCKQRKITLSVEKTHSTIKGFKFRKLDSKQYKQLNSYLHKFKSLK